MILFNRKIHQKLDRLIQQQGELIMTLTDLQNQVHEVVGVEQSAIALLQGLKTALDQALAANDPALLQAISDELGAKTAELASAVSANTPA